MIFKDITETNFNGIDISSHFEFDHEKVFYFEDSKSGLKSLIAIHRFNKWACHWWMQI